MKRTRVLLFVFLLFIAFSGTQVFGSIDTTGRGDSASLKMSFFKMKKIEGSSTAKVTSTDKGVNNITFTNPYNTSHTQTVWAGTLTGTIDNSTTKFYCIDIAHSLAFYTTSQPHTYADSGATPSQITYILNNYYPYKTYPYTGSASTVEIEAAAVQLAIWHFSDGVDINTVNNSTIKTRALVILADANAHGNNLIVASAISIIPGTQNLPIGTKAYFVTQALDATGSGVNNLTVTYNATDGTLSASSALTDTSGTTSSVSLTKGSGTTAVVTASATFMIPQGTKFMHAVSPDTYQKLVLATPVMANRSAKSTITWYTPSATCDLSGSKTFTQGGWGSSSKSAPGKIRDNNFASVFPSGMTVGGGFTLTFTTAAAVMNFLPAGGTASALTASATNPTSSSAGVLAGQIVALALNVAYDNAGYLGTNSIKLKDQVIVSGTFIGKTVSEFLAIANTALGGGTTGYSYSDINSAATSINENFDNGTSNNGFLTCNTTAMKADLSLLKSVDKSSPAVGDTINFTLVVSNAGPGTATGVKVTDILPSGFQFLSYTSGAGTYDNTTGVWNVGSIAANASYTLRIKVKVNVVAINNGYFNLGPAADYNVFVLEDINQPSSDTQGKMAVGRDATLTNYSIGDQLPIVQDLNDVFIVGNNLTFGSGSVYGGNVVYGNATNLPKMSVTITDGTLRQDSKIDFAEAASYLQNLSCQLGGYTVNSTTVSDEWGNVTCTGAQPFLNVFSIADTVINKAGNVDLTAPNGSVVVVNILGKDVNWKGGLTITGTDITNVIYNFPEAQNITIGGIDVRGSILAPFAHVNFTAGVQNGQMIAKSITGAGQFNNAKFIGNVPLDTTLVNIAEISHADLLDPDSSPANGVTTEDDYSAVAVHVTGATGASGSSGSSGSLGNWKFLGAFPSGELVWTLTNDINGAMLAGTFGGNIYRSTDDGATWTKLNQNMGAGYIWSLKAKSNGTLFAGCDKGIYRSTNNGASWDSVGLGSYDVRSIAITANGTVLAGTWGKGLFTSTDNGVTWVHNTTALADAAVHALAINSSGEVFAGTYGTGMYKSTDNGVNWTHLSMDYDFVWTLGITGNGTIIAGTYGKGVYRSTDNGATWAVVNNGLHGRFMYATTIDAANNVYVSAWAGGVYASTDNGANWSSIGLQGYNVSSIITNPKAKVLYAGTSDGKIYYNESPLAVEQVKTGIPSQFNIAQNYPNPFNPTTVIRVEVPKIQNVTLKVFNILGQEVRTLLNQIMNPGTYNVTFDGKNLASGIYIYQLKAGTVQIARKMVLQK